MKLPQFTIDLFKKWHLLVKVIPFLVLILGLKFLFHFLGFETLSLSALFTSIVGATIFLVGFLISGVLSDYKEAEKIPSELACSLELIHDETLILYKSKKSKESKEFLLFQQKFLESILNWLYKKEDLENIYKQLTQMNDYFMLFEPQTQAAFISRMKNEQHTIRKLLTRIHIIASTSFVQSAYAIAEALAFFLVIGLLILKIEPFYEAIFLVTLVSFLVIYMILLIKDLDNPFDYSDHGESGSEVSLEPIRNLQLRMAENINNN
jgi:hypothetical protein